MSYTVTIEQRGAELYRHAYADLEWALEGMAAAMRRPEGGEADAVALVRAGARVTYGHTATRTWLRITGALPVAALASARGWEPWRGSTDTWVRLVPGREE